MTYSTTIAPAAAAEGHAVDDVSVLATMRPSMATWWFPRAHQPTQIPQPQRDIIEQRGAVVMEVDEEVQVIIV